MALETAKHAIERHMATPEFRELEIGLHGGEPFLCFDMIRALCEWTWRQEWPLPYVFFSTTNGTLVHGDIQVWLKENSHRFYCALSLDGTPEMHNTNRSQSYNRIDVDFFRETWPDQPAKMTVSSLTLSSLAKGIQYLHSLELPFTCNLACSHRWDPLTSVETLTRELRKLTQFYLNNPRIVPCDLLKLPIYKIIETHELTRRGMDFAVNKWCGFGTSIVAVGVNGDEYPCHLLVPFKGSEGQSDLVCADYSDLQLFMDRRCHDCELAPICPTCYAANLSARGALASRDHIECALFRVQVQAAAYMYAEMLGSNRGYEVFADFDDERTALTIDSILKCQQGLLSTPSDPNVSPVTLES